MKISSTSFTDGDVLDARFAHDAVDGGQNLIPQLSWENPPRGTKSFALTCYDPDAPTGSGYWHLISWDIPLDVLSIEEGAALPEGAHTTANDYGFEGYGGPNPPTGPAHRYIFTVYAMPDETLGLPDGLTSANTRFNIVTRAIDSTSIMGWFAQP